MLSRSDPEYRHAIDFLYGRLNYERSDTLSFEHDVDVKLDRMRRLLEPLGNPHLGIPTIHVAGTKGKGSTSHFLASMLTCAGYQTGCYTSPHLMSIEERFAINGVPCTPADFVKLVNDLKPVVYKLDAQRPAGGGPTFFEITTAMAMLYFCQQRTDVMVLEVGLGGRLDSTNVCKPDVCVITSISFDHMRQLGNTLASIAQEKAGIIKPRVPIVTGVRSVEPLTVIERIAATRQADLFCLGRDFDFDYEPVGSATIDADAERPHTQTVSKPPALGPSFDFYYLADGRRTLGAKHIPLSALGHHQGANASLAWFVCDLLQQQGYRINEAARHKGLASSSCPGRIEVIRQRPTVVVDTAHNDASIEALVQVLQESFPSRPRTLILAATQGKSVDAMLRRLLTEFDIVICTEFLNNPRAMPATELFRRAQRLSMTSDHPVRLRSACSPEAAWHDACQDADVELICATGSFFLAAEVKAVLER